jgi:hypothetical protein
MKKNTKPPRRAEKKKQFYGIAEWYGYRFIDLSNDKRKDLVHVKNTKMACPYFQQIPALGPQSGNLNCNKSGGVCSLRNFHPPQEPDDDITFGPITATCPNRFLENGTIIKHIGKELLGTDNPLIAKEIPFLRRPKSAHAAASIAEAEEEAMHETGEEGTIDPGQEDVGRIDLVFVHPEDGAKWCAVEMQAVYFSGGAMSKDHAEILAFKGNGVPMPGAARRPDFRSSGPKRLMPQLMIKVPTLRRWGKKMVVVVDRPFLDALDDMEPMDHISNCDIVWVVVTFDESEEPSKAVLKIDQTLYTTLEDAVKGLTAGKPTTLPEFERKLEGKVIQTAAPFTKAKP